MCRNYKRKGNIRLQKKALAEKNISAENPCLAEKSVLMEKNGKEYFGCNRWNGQREKHGAFRFRAGRAV